MPARQSIMRALSGQQWPGPADAGSVEGGAIFVLAVAVAVIAVPARSLGQFHAEQGVDRAQRVEDARIIRRAQAETHQRQRVGADDVVSALPILAGRTILDG